MTDIAEKLVAELDKMGVHIYTVESCTGGALASAITNIPGASEVFREGSVVYGNAAKERLDHRLGREGHVARLIQSHGVYSHEVAADLAEMGAEMADIGVGVTGTLSREDPANPCSDVGIAYIGVAAMGNKAVTRLVYVDAKLSRTKAKRQIVEKALGMVLDVLEAQRT